jgi:hypothetical protein
MNNTWWCMDCRSSVELDKHGRCESCESEAVDPLDRNGSLANAVSMSHHEAVIDSLVCA